MEIEFDVSSSGRDQKCGWSFGQADEMRTHFEKLNGLKFPALEKLTLTCVGEDWGNGAERPEAMHQVFALEMLRIVKRLLRGAQGLRSFDGHLLFDNDEGVQAYCLE